MDLGKLIGGIDGDDIKQALELISNNKDNLQKLGKLPEFLDKIADGLDDAGGQAKAAATALVGTDGDSGMRGTLGDCAEALAGIAKTIAAGVAKLSDTADGVARVPLMDGPAGHLKSATKDLAGTTDMMTDLSHGLTSVAETLAAVGKALDGLGDHLGQSGGQARGFVNA